MMDVEQGHLSEMASFSTVKGLLKINGKVQAARDGRHFDVFEVTGRWRILAVV